MRLGLAYTKGHIEVDNRLSWMLGRLDKVYADDLAIYVHLKRNRSLSRVSSFVRNVSPLPEGSSTLIKTTSF